MDGADPVVSQRPSSASTGRRTAVGRVSRPPRTVPQARRRRRPRHGRIAATATSRTRRALDEAELQFVARVVADGGIGPWRTAADQRFRTALTTFARHGRLSRRVVADLVVALADQPTRDRRWWVVESGDDADWTAFWLHLSRRALPPYRAEPLFLLAWSAWRLGDVGLARAAANAVLTQDPGHRAAAMLLALLWLGVQPGRLPSLAVRSVAPAGAS
jgi:hypothetical protein